ncbi:MAG: hypothetical protein D3910_15965 [Candidatus Electrothrix sp. ATG2]|nr:hypothetical protein [Candidatus Electrothrix sp. ATG2]
MAESGGGFVRSCLDYNQFIYHHTPSLATYFPLFLSLPLVTRISITLSDAPSSSSVASTGQPPDQCRYFVAQLGGNLVMPGVKEGGKNQACSFALLP